MSDGLWKQCIAGQRVRLGFFAGIDIRFAGVSGGIDEEVGFCFAQEFQQEIIPRVIKFFASERDERLRSFAQSLSEGLSNVTTSAKEHNHEGMWLSRLASAMTLSR